MVTANAFAQCLVLAMYFEVTVETVQAGLGVAMAMGAASRCALGMGTAAAAAA